MPSAGDRWVSESPPCLAYLLLSCIRCAIGQVRDLAFLARVQNFTAQGAIGPSTLRNAGSARTVSSARAALTTARLDGFRVRSRADFQHQLNRLTRHVRRALPPPAAKWGTARKATNIFLRNALYNTNLADEYGLHRLEPWLELPLGSYTVRGLRAEESGLPKMARLFARGLVAVRRLPRGSIQGRPASGRARVHLDMLWWRWRCSKVRIPRRLPYPLRVTSVAATKRP